MNNQMVMTVRGLADRLQVSMPTAYALTEKHGFPVIRVGRKKLIPIVELEKWLSVEAHKGA